MCQILIILPKKFKLFCFVEIIGSDKFLECIGQKIQYILKVWTNEKVGGSGRWQMFGIVLGPKWSIFLILPPSCNKFMCFFGLLQLIEQAMAGWIGNVLLTVSRTSPFWIFMCLQYHYFSRFANHVGRCCLLLSNHAVQPISGSYVWYLANRKPSLPHLPSPAFKNYCNCEKMCQYFTHQTWPIIGAADMAARCLFKILILF